MRSLTDVVPVNFIYNPQAATPSISAILIHLEPYGAYSIIASLPKIQL